MTLEQEYTYRYNRGKEDGAIETAKKLLKMNVLSKDQIAEVVGFSLADLEKALSEFSDDFYEEGRNQPEMQKREGL